MTPSPLRELAKKIRGEGDIASRFGQYDRLHAIADKLESLAGEYAVVPRVPTDAMRRAAQVADMYHGDHEEWLHEEWDDHLRIYRAMIEAAERQEASR